MLDEISVTQEQFLEAAKIGLSSKDDKKYFEQLIACDNYAYFKNMMIKRNLQLEEQAMNLMQEKTGKTLDSEKPNNKEIDPAWEHLKKHNEQIELECALQMSIALEDEKRKILDSEDEELTVSFIL